MAESWVLPLLLLRKVVCVQPAHSSRLQCLQTAAPEVCPLVLASSQLLLGLHLQCRLALLPVLRRCLPVPLPCRLSPSKKIRLPVLVHRWLLPLACQTTLSIVRLVCLRRLP